MSTLNAGKWPVGGREEMPDSEPSCLANGCNLEPAHSGPHSFEDQVVSPAGCTSTVWAGAFAMVPCGLLPGHAGRHEGAIRWPDPLPE
jgi:hypothetical protein